MASKKQRREQALSEVQTFLDEWLSRSGTKPAAFRDWAVEQALWEQGLSPAEVQQVTAIDGPNDFGLDGWLFQADESPQVLHVFQSKDTSPDRKDLLGLRDGLTALFDPDRSKHANDEARLQAEEFRDRAGDDVQIEFYLVTSDIAPAPLRDHADGLGNERLSLFERSYATHYTVLDIEDLSQNLRVAHDKPILASFEVGAGDFFTPSKAGPFKTYTVAVPARQLARLFSTERTNLFRLNPRYYQTTKTAVNKEVLGTLLGPERSHFFYLNNGVTAVSSGVSAKKGAEDSVRISAHDFQIVNGCQTTVTIHEAWRRRDGGELAIKDVFVLLRIIEAPQAVAPLIARTTNSQNPMKSEDFRANDDRQIRLRREFELLSPPWFYEHKRGLWSFENQDAESRKPYLTGDNAPRHIGMKDTAQVALAFLGSPAEAVDRIRFTFTTDDRYEKVFPKSILASQLLLPVLIYRRANDVANASKMKYPWAPYLRYPVVACVSRLLHELMGEQPDRYFNKTASETLANRIDEWGELIDKCFNALLLEVDELSKKGTGARSLVRQTDWLEKPYQVFRAAVQERVESEDKIAQQLGKDPKELGFRAIFPYPIRGFGK